jgi:hypothetical protein
MCQAEEMAEEKNITVSQEMRTNIPLPPQNSKVTALTDPAHALRDTTNYY